MTNTHSGADANVSRRRLLGSAAATGGMAAAISLLPSNLDTALAAQASTSGPAARLRDAGSFMLRSPIRIGHVHPRLGSRRHRSEIHCGRSPRTAASNISEDRT